MPIVDIELVSDTVAPIGLAAELAEAVGAAIGAATGATWVRLRRLPRSHYAESGGGPPDGVAPVFVTIMARARPSGEALVRQVDAVTEAVAAHTTCPFENVHVIFEPEAAGRVAFGGTLVD